MSSPNPYQTPRAPLEDREPRGRPVWVWVISIVYGLGVIATLALAPLLLAAELDATGWALLALGTLLSAAFVVQLFRLRAVAVQLCAAQMLTTLASGVWDLLRGSGAEGPGAAQVILGSMLFTLLVDCAVLAYCVHQQRTGLLR